MTDTTTYLYVKSLMFVLVFWGKTECMTCTAAMLILFIACVTGKKGFREVRSKERLKELLLISHSSCLSFIQSWLLNHWSRSSKSPSHDISSLNANSAPIKGKLLTSKRLIKQIIFWTIEKLVSKTHFHGSRIFTTDDTMSK